MAEKKPDTAKCLRAKMMQQADDYLAEIDQALGDNAQLQRSGREPVGTTPDPESDLSS